MPAEGPPPIVAEEQVVGGSLFPTRRGLGLGLRAEMGTHMNGHDGLVHGGALGALLVEQARQLGGAGQPLWIKSIIIRYPHTASLSGGLLETSGNLDSAQDFQVKLKQDGVLAVDAVGSYVLLNPYTTSHEIGVSYNALPKVPVDDEVYSTPGEILSWAEKNKKEKLVSYIKSAMPFYENLGVYDSFYYNSASRRTQIDLRLSKKHSVSRNGVDTVDEGLVVALIDSCSGAQVFTQAQDDQIPVTRENVIHFRSPIPAGGTLRVLSGVSERIVNKFKADSEVWHFPQQFPAEPVLVATAMSKIRLVSSGIMDPKRK